MQQELYYKDALKLGQKEYRARLAKDEDPYLPVLDNIVPPEKGLQTIHLGITQIPVFFILGTKTAGRTNAFAANFMPLLEEGTEFAEKWEVLYRSHLSEGIRDPIKVYEYMNRYYVQEGNKRVSVLKYCNAYSIPADVIRVMPEPSDDEAVQLYYEYVEFYRVTKINFLEFTKRGGYRELLNSMGKSVDERWSVEEQRRFSGAYYYFEQAYRQNGGEKLKTTIGDAMLSYIRIYGYTELEHAGISEIKSNLKKMWEEIALQENDDEIDLKTAPSQENKSKPITKTVLEKVFDIKPSAYKVAFIYDIPPEKSGWINDHELGRRHAQTVLGNRVATSVYMAESEETLYSTLEKAIKDGNRMIFTVSPRMLKQSLRAAVEHPEAVVMNCSLNIAHRYLRTYYPRMYEVKFILGALAGSLTETNRLGYVCDYPIYGQIAGINAFALGAQLATPRATVFLEWSSVKGAKEATLSLNRQHINLISSQDTARFQEDDRVAFGLSRIADGRTNLLAVPVWKWGVYYERILRAAIDSTIKEEYDNSTRAVNYFWGMSEGVVDLEYAPGLPLSSRRYADFFRDSLIHGAGTPFLTPFYTQSGEIVGARQRELTPDQIIRMDYLAENVVGSIPSYKEMTQKGQDTVDMAGIPQAKKAVRKEENE